MTEKKDFHDVNMNSVYAVWGSERSSEQFYPNWVYEDATTWTETSNIMSYETTETTSMKSTEQRNVRNPNPPDEYVLQVIEELKKFMGDAAEQASNPTSNEIEDITYQKSQFFPAVLGMGGESSKLVNGELVPVSKLDKIVGFELRPSKKTIVLACDDMMDPP